MALIINKWFSSSRWTLCKAQKYQNVVVPVSTGPAREVKGIGDPTFWIVKVAQPVHDDCLEREHETIIYRLMEMLIGNGYNRKYLHRIGKKTTTSCHHCRCDEDTAQHMLIECPAWCGEPCDLHCNERRPLSASLGEGHGRERQVVKRGLKTRSSIKELDVGSEPLAPTFSLYN